jgi:hypothetical protein
MAVRLEVEHEALVTDAVSVWSASALSALIDLIVPTHHRSVAISGEFFRRRSAHHLDLCPIFAMVRAPVSEFACANGVPETPATTPAWKRDGWNSVCVDGVVSRSSEPETLIP